VTSWFIHSVLWNDILYYGFLSRARPDCQTLCSGPVRAKMSSIRLRGMFAEGIVNKPENGADA
jgi:hypothetical protein